MSYADSDAAMDRMPVSEYISARAIEHRAEAKEMLPAYQIISNAFHALEDWGAAKDFDSSDVESEYDELLNAMDELSAQAKKFITRRGIEL